MSGNVKFAHLIEAIVYIAINAKPNAVRGTEICNSLKLPPRYLENSLQELVHRGVLRSVRGPKGGYVLAKERRNITLSDIYEAVKAEDKPAGDNYVWTALKAAEEKFREELAKITVESLCLKAGAGTPQKADFTI